MSAYHSGAFTLRPEVLIPPPGQSAPAAGITAEAAAEIHALSVDYVAAHGGDVSLIETLNSGGYVEVDVDYKDGAELPPDTEIEWDWGDGSPREVGHDKHQGHAYGRGGRFQIHSSIRRPGEPSMAPLPLEVDV